MDSISEVFVVSDSSNQHTVCSFYDLKTGGLITTFKDTGNTAPNCAKKSLSFIGQDFIISAAIKQPILRVWTLLSKNVDMLKIVVPGEVSSLAVSNCGMYCVAGIDKLLYFWEVATGALMTILQHHSQAITCVKFSVDGAYIVSASKDGMVLVWLLDEVISASEHSDNVKPRFTWLDHAAPVTDIYIGNLTFPRVITVSNDMTCRIHELPSGFTLATVHVDFAVTAITMDESEYFMFLGSAEGNIYRINMFAANRSEIEYSSSNKPCVYVGHSKEITCLSVSTTGKYLLSGSEDCFCRIWDLMTFTCVRKLKFEGSITNAFITFLPPGMDADSKYLPQMKVSSFKRHYESDETDMDYITTVVRSRDLSLMHLGTPCEYFHPFTLNCSEDTLTGLNRNHLTEKKMYSINQEMYAFALGEAYNNPEAYNNSESQMDDDDEEEDSD